MSIRQASTMVHNSINFIKLMMFPLKRNNYINKKIWKKLQPSFLFLTYIGNLQSAGDVHIAVVLDIGPGAIVKHEPLQQQHQNFWVMFHHTTLSDKIRSTRFQRELSSSLSTQCLQFNTEVIVNWPQNSYSPLWHLLFHHSDRSTSD